MYGAGVEVGTGCVAVGMGEALGAMVKVGEGEEVGRGVAVKTAGDGDEVGERSLGALQATMMTPLRINFDRMNTHLFLVTIYSPLTKPLWITDGKELRAVVVVQEPSLPSCQTG
jgi:hypothetical protein